MFSTVLVKCVRIVSTIVKNSIILYLIAYKLIIWPYYYDISLSEIYIGMCMLVV